MVVRLLSSAILVVCTAFKNASWKSDKRKSEKKSLFPAAGCGIAWQAGDKLKINST